MMNRIGKISLISIFTSVFSFGFIMYAVNTELIYYHQQIAWQNSPEFLRHYLTFAGGLAEYFTLFISQLFYKNWLGSLVVALVTFLISYLLFCAIKKRYKSFDIAYFIIPLISIVVVSLMTDYNYHFSITINILFIALVIFLSERIKKQYSLTTSYHIIIGGILVFYFSGGIYFLLYMLTSLITGLKKINGKELINITIIVVAAILIPFISNKFIFLTSMKMSYFRAYPEVALMLRYSRPILFYLLLGAIPFLFFLVSLFNMIINGRKVNSNKNNDANKRQSKLFGVINYQRVRSLFLIIVWSLIAAFVITNSFNLPDKIKNEIDYKAYYGNWDDVIELSHQLKDYDRMVNFQYNRALLHNDKLLDNLFSYKQILGVQALFLDIPFTAEVALPNSDLYFDLGNIDESQRLAFEAQTLMPYSPKVLKRMVQNSIIMGNNNAAEVFCNVLIDNPLEKKWSYEYRSLLDNPKSVQKDPVILEKINNADKAQGLRLTPRDKMLSLLQHNPKNRAAFEYLIAFDLMEHDLNSFSEDLKFIANLNYSKLPRVIEEAIVLFVSQRPDNDYLKSFRISTNTVDNFREFASITRSHRGDIESAKKAAIKFDDTYWYYVLFLSPLVTNLRLETRPAETNY